MTTAERIKAAIDLSRTPVAVIAARIGVQRGAVYRWIRGETAPSVARLQQLALATGQPVSYFLPLKRVAPTLVVTRHGEEIYRLVIDEATELRIVPG